MERSLLFLYRVNLLLRLPKACSFPIITGFPRQSFPGAIFPPLLSHAVLSKGLKTFRPGHRLGMHACWWYGKCRDARVACA